MAKKWARSVNTAIEAVAKAEEKFTSRESSDFWKPTRIEGKDKSNYVIRVLPDPGSEDGVDWLLRKAHMVKFPNGKFMYEPCPQKFRGSCPICSHVNPLFNSGNPADEKIAYDHYAKKRYFMNVYVVEDPRNDGEKEGKVFIWECPKKVMEDILLPALKEDKIMFSCPYEGADLKLVITEEGGYTNYGKSRMGSQAPIGDDSEIEDLMSKAIDLKEKLYVETCFKSEEELWHLYTHDGERLSDGAKAKAKPTATTTATTSATKSSVAKDEEADFDLPDDEIDNAVEEEEVKTPPKTKTESKAASDDDDDLVSEEDFDIDDDEIEDLVNN